MFYIIISLGKNALRDEKGRLQHWKVISSYKVEFALHMIFRRHLCTCPDSCCCCSSTDFPSLQYLQPPNTKFNNSMLLEYLFWKWVTVEIFTSLETFNHFSSSLTKWASYASRHWEVKSEYLYVLGENVTARENCNLMWPLSHPFL